MMILTILALTVMVACLMYICCASRVPDHLTWTVPAAGVLICVLAAAVLFSLRYRRYAKVETLEERVTELETGQWEVVGALRELGADIMEAPDGEEGQPGE